MNNEPDISTKIVQNGKETTADTAPETSWVPKNPPPAAAQAEPVRRVGSVTLGICLIAAGIFFFAYHFLPNFDALLVLKIVCLLYTSPSPRDGLLSRMPSSA